ncbi:MAG: hypothetical protein PHX82_00895 [Paracoccaceae bacterium]|nr:hypothetical protein [Paracoccaceae bacterium]
MTLSELKICTVADGLEAVLRLAGLLARLQGVASRIDLQLSEALAVFAESDSDRFDLILVAPADLTRSADSLRGVLGKASRLNAEVLVILPETAAIPAGLPASVRVLVGPPFPKGGMDALLAVARPVESPPLAAPDMPPALRKGGILRRFRKSAEAAPAQAPVSGLFVGGSTPIETIVVQGTCGGAGATTFATNLAVELAARRATPQGGAAVCLLDLNLQFGNVANYLDLQETSRVSDAYRNLSRLDGDAFLACLQPIEPGLQVFTSPPDLVPMDALGGSGFDRLLDCARAVAPLVVIDMPPVLTDWSEQAFNIADRVLCVSLLDVRAAHNARHIASVMKAIGLPAARVRHILNRAAPKRGGDLMLRVRKFEQGLGTAFDALLSDGGAEVSTACDLGHSLRKACPANPLAREIHRLAQSVPARRIGAQDLSAEVSDVDL